MNNNEKIVEASYHNDTANDIIERAGVETFETNAFHYWKYNGKTVLRPWANKFEDKLLEEFGIKVVYTDKPETE